MGCDLGGGADDGGPAAWRHQSTTEHETRGLRVHIWRVFVVVVAADITERRMVDCDFRVMKQEKRIIKEGVPASPNVKCQTEQKRGPCSKTSLVRCGLLGYRFTESHVLC